MVVRVQFHSAADMGLALVPKVYQKPIYLRRTVLDAGGKPGTCWNDTREILRKQVWTGKSNALQPATPPPAPYHVNPCLRGSQLYFMEGQRNFKIYAQGQMNTTL